MPAKLTTEIFIERSQKIHGDLYDYSITKYNNAIDKIVIFCKKCNKCFKQSPYHHLNGNGCKICAYANNGENRKQSKQDFIQKAQLKHNNKYNYDLINDFSNKKEINIICNICNNIFKQKPSDHLSGCGCPSCGIIKRRMTHDEFIRKANIIHDLLYNYSLTKYTNSRTKIIIICKKCNNIFNQKPSCHLSGKGCPKCGFEHKGFISNVEKKWLDSLNIPEQYRQKHLSINNRRFLVDAFNPLTKTIYEFYGNYWHGNPKIYNDNIINSKMNGKTMKELYDKTMERESIFKLAGFTIISIWESDYNKST